MSEVSINQIPTYRIPIYGNIQCIDYDLFECNCDTKEFSPIVVNNDNELNIDICGQIVPFKYSTIGTDENLKYINSDSIFTNDNAWKTNFNDRYHIYDGDLPYIDIRLLCQYDPNNKLLTCMIPYDSISVDRGNGSITCTGGGDNSVTAANLSTALNNLINYLKINSANGDINFWTDPVNVTA